MSVFRTVMGCDCYFSKGKIIGLTRIYNGDLRPLNLTLGDYGFRVVRRGREQEEAAASTAYQAVDPERASGGK